MKKIMAFAAFMSLSSPVFAAHWVAFPAPHADKGFHYELDTDSPRLDTAGQYRSVQVEPGNFVIYRVRIHWAKPQDGADSEIDTLYGNCGGEEIELHTIRTEGYRNGRMVSADTYQSTFNRVEDETAASEERACMIAKRK